MDLNLLQDLGLTENEAQIYLSLIQIGESTANKISEKTGLHRGYVYDTLSKMVNKGLVSYITKSGKKYFKGIHPNRFLGMIKEKEEKVKDLIPELLKLYNEDKAEYEIEVLEGKEGIKSYIEQFIQYIENRKLPGIMQIGRKVDLLNDYFMKYYFSNVTRRATKSGYYDRMKKKQKKHKWLFDYSVKGKPRLMKQYADYKYLPKNFDSGKFDLTVFEDNVSIQCFKEKPFVINIKNKEMANFFKQIFNQLWMISEKP